jgi:hypothetical protein
MSEQEQLLTIKKSRRRPHKRGDVSIHLPEGKEIVEVGREGLALEATTKDKDKVAAQLDIEPKSYRRLREILLLYDARDDLIETDRDAVVKAYKIMVETSSVKRAHGLVQRIANKVWGVKTHRTVKKAHERIEQFQIVMTKVAGLCEAAATMEMPYLPADEVERTDEMIKDAKKALAALETKLRELSR